MGMSSGDPGAIGGLVVLNIAVRQAPVLRLEPNSLGLELALSVCSYREPKVGARIRGPVYEGDALFVAEVVQQQFLFFGAVVRPVVLISLTF